MLNRKVSVAACAWLAAGAAAFGQASGNAYLFQVLPATSGSDTAELVGYNAGTNNFSIPLVDTQLPAGTSRIIAKPDGSKFYFLVANSVQVADPGFVNFRAVNGITGAPASVAITPDGKYLLIGAGAPSGALYIVDTNTDQVIGNVSPLSAAVVQQYGIAITQDSKRAFVLANNSFEQSTVTAVDLTTLQQIGANNLTLIGLGRGIALSPLNLLYVTAGNAVYEIDPATVSVTTGGQIGIVADPGPPRFTPDGTTLYCINHTPGIGGASIIQVNLANRFVAAWPPFNPQITPPLLDDVYIAGNGRIFAWSSQSMSLLDVNPVSLSAVASSLNSVAGASNVTGIAVSTEIPSAHYLFLETTSGSQISLDRVDLTRNVLDLTGPSTVGSPPLLYVTVPPVSGPATFIQYNNLQTVVAGATSLPLVALVLDALGRPVYNQAVTFTTDPASGAFINSPNATTNANGYVQTTVSIPKNAQGGVITITLTAGAASTTFTLTVPAAGGGGGGTGGTSQVTIVSGDGQIGFFPYQGAIPMTIRVTDTSGMPRANVPVSFATASAGVNIQSSNVTTDSNGLASSLFSFGPPSSGAAYLANIITASTPLGAVSFTETSVPSQPNCSQCPPPAQPAFILDSPADNMITIGAGTVIPNAVVARIYGAGSPQLGSPPIPGIGVSIVNSCFQASFGCTPTPSPAASCQGDPLSDQNGRVSCNVVATCNVPPGTVTPVAYLIGGFRGYEGSIKTVQGAASQIQKLAGDNQSGRSGQQLATPLLAQVTDGCGSPVAGAQVQWVVIQGSATVANASNTSDSAGRITTQVTFGQTPGSVKVKAVLGTVTQAVFTLTNQVVVSIVNVVSGNNQTAFINQAFAQPLVVSVLDDSNNPVAGITVTYSITSGSAVVNASGATTDAQGHASAMVSAGATAGSVTITAAYGTLSATFTLTVRPPGPSIAATSFLNAAFGAGSGGPPGLVPCGLTTVTGPGLAPNLQGVVSGVGGFGPLPYTLAGVSITVSGVPAPIQSVANQNGVQSVNFQTPCEVPPGTATLIVQVSGGSTTVSGVAVFAAAPGVFNYQGPNGKAYGAVVDASTGNYVTPSNPAHPGGTYYMYVTGLGQVSPAISTNSSGTVGTTQNVNLPVIAGVDNAGVPVVFAQYATGYIGVYIVGFQIPQNAPTGTDQPLAVAVLVNGQLVFGNPTYLPAVN